MPTLKEAIERKRAEKGGENLMLRILAEDALAKAVADLREALEAYLKEHFDQRIDDVSKRTERALDKRIERASRVLKDRISSLIPTLKGKDGAEPSDERLKELIKPLIPQVKAEMPSQGMLRRIMRPLLPDPPNEAYIIDRVLSQVPTPTQPSAEAIADIVMQKIGEKSVTVEDVEGLNEKLSVLQRNILSLKQRKTPQTGGGGGGGMGNWVTDNATGDGSTTEFTLSNRVASGGTAIMVLLNGQSQELTTHFSVNNQTKTVTFTTAPFDGAAIHFWYVRA